MWQYGGMQIKVYHNTDTDFIHKYKVGQALKLVDTFDVEKLEEVTNESPIKEILERVYRIHNTVDGTERNAKLRVRSLSVGDVVEVEGARWAVATLGFEPVEKAEKTVGSKGGYTIHNYLEDIEHEEKDDL